MNVTPQCACLGQLGRGDRRSAAAQAGGQHWDDRCWLDRGVAARWHDGLGLHTRYLVSPASTPAAPPQATPNAPSPRIVSDPKPNPLVGRRGRLGSSFGGRAGPSFSSPIIGVLEVRLVFSKRVAPGSMWSRRSELLPGSNGADLSDEVGMLANMAPQHVRLLPALAGPVNIDLMRPRQHSRRHFWLQLGTIRAIALSRKEMSGAAYHHGKGAKGGPVARSGSQTAPAKPPRPARTAGGG